MSSATESAQVDRSNWREFLLIVTVTTVAVVVGLYLTLQGNPITALMGKMFSPLVWLVVVMAGAVHTLRLRACLPVLLVTLTVATLGAMQLKQLR